MEKLASEDLATTPADILVVVEVRLLQDLCVCVCVCVHMCVCVCVCVLHTMTNLQ